MTVYPIIVERYVDNQAITIACQHCHAEKVIDPDDISSEGKLDYTMPLAGCCSRKCALQAEYAESLKAQA